MNTDIQVPAAGQPESTVEITDDQINLILGGLLIPNQGFSKALAREVQRLRTENAALKRPVTDEEWLARVRKWDFGDRWVCGFERRDVDSIIASRSQEAQKGATE